MKLALIRAEAAAGIDWDSRWDHILDDSNAPFYRWFSGGRLNTCYNALDRHVERGRGAQTAIIYDSPLAGNQRSISYSELRDEVALFAGAMASSGVEKGDRVIIYMPMIPEAIVAVLACARLGAVHSVVFGGFEPRDLGERTELTGAPIAEVPVGASHRERPRPGSGAGRKKYCQLE